MEDYNASKDDDSKNWLYAKLRLAFHVEKMFVSYYLCSLKFSKSHRIFTLRFCIRSQFRCLKIKFMQSFNQRFISILHPQWCRAVFHQRNSSLPSLPQKFIQFGEENILSTSRQEMGREDQCFVIRATLWEGNFPISFNIDSLNGHYCPLLDIVKGTQKLVSHHLAAVWPHRRLPHREAESLTGYFRNFTLLFTN